MSFVKTIFASSVKLIIKEALQEVLKEAVRREKITTQQSDRLIEIAAELGHVKIGK